MPETDKPLLIKRYASRRLYNTETSDYVTLEDIAAFIRQGRDVQIVDLKSGIDIEPVGESNVGRITVKGPSRRVAAIADGSAAAGTVQSPASCRGTGD